MQNHQNLIVIALLAVVGGLAFGITRGRNAPEAPGFVSPAYGEDFWKHWGDGQAELAGYDLTYPRYGELRAGTALTIFVTETFDNDQRVKAGAPRLLGGGSFPVMKLNLVQDFPTGVYDYNLMTSAFAALEPVNGRPAGSLTKVSFSAQEWCGHAFAQLLFDANGVRYQSHSYFDGEADVQSTIENPQQGLSEDGLLLWARGLAAPALAPGESREIRLLRSLERARLLHQGVDWQAATLARGADPITVTVPAGSFVAEVFTVTHDQTVGGIPGTRTLTFRVERDPPHRIVGWSDSEGLNAELLASKRLRYWAMQSNGMESALSDLGLAPRR